MHSEPETGTTELVYVRLRGEGTTVYRPAAASSAGKDLARLIAPEGYDPDDEDWEFKPGTLVRLESTRLELRYRSRRPPLNWCVLRQRTTPSCDSTRGVGHHVTG